MDISALVDLAFNALPAGTKGTGTFSRTVPGVLDFASGERAGDSTQSFDATLVMTTPKPDDTGDDVTRNLRARRVLYVKASDAPYAILPDMNVTINGESWGIDRIDPTIPDGVTVVLYTLYVSH